MEKAEKFFVTKDEVAEAIGISPCYLAVQLRLHPENYPPFRKIGRKYIFLIDDFKLWLKNTKKC